MRLAFRCLFYGAITAVFVGSLLPVSQVEPIFVLKDWLIHFAAYAFCGLLAAYGFKSPANKSRAFVGLFTTGAIIEVVQPYVGRHFDWFDLSANSMGILAAILGRVVLKQIVALIFKRETSESA